MKTTTALGLMALTAHHPSVLAQGSAVLAAPEIAAEEPVAEAIGNDVPKNAIEPICELDKTEPVIIPKMTVVVLEIGETVGSKISESGQMFDLMLAEPLIIDGGVVLPAGLRGKGEVIHAKRAGGSGSAGELILAATHLDFEDTQIKLRSMKLGRTGASNIGLATAVGVATGPLGFLISGKNTEVTAGTIVEAKFAQDYSVPNSESKNTEDAPCLKEGTL